MCCAGVYDHLFGQLGVLDYLALANGLASPKFYRAANADEVLIMLSHTNQKIHQMHRDIVFDPADGDRPAGAEVVASNALCSNQAMYVPRRLISVQGHPEFTSEIVSEILELRHNKGMFSDDVYRGGMDRVNNHHDGILIGKAFLKFCRDQ